LTDRNEKHINVGFKTAVLSNISWTGYGQVQGYVFIDANGDGIKNEAEKGIAGAKVTVAGTLVLTDDQGYYCVKSVRSGLVAARFDQASAGQGYILTSANPQMIDLTAGKTARADFGIITKSSVTGIAFNDVNKSGAFDESDTPVAGIDIVFDGKTYTTAADGTYVIYDVKEGRHSISISIDSLPQNFVPAIPVNNTIDVKRGSSYKFDIPMNSTGASVSVRVFIDKNNNKKWESGEGVENASVKIAGSVYSTDTDGNVTAQLSKTGKMNIALNTKSLPKGYILSGPAVKTVNLKDNQSISVNFILRKSSSPKSAPAKIKKQRPPLGKKSYI
jgi:hypothetical protein